MVVGEVVDLSGSILLELGKIGLWLQTLGVIILFWLIVQIITLIMNRKKRKAIYSMKEDLVRIEKKLDKLCRKK
ncbi:MAG: hypothetical protein QT05_C0028G0009 [archaeon GW2011_AR13]|nr:MAG: hypothetical protein QT05_C0028G0009 [archaeon GW2011_AR13]HIG94401.1 hypothetical protein [Nanoarchaeota archaeon]HIH63560.1 hypothetical protein [Nanoarchaeota archaeon]HIJ09341.1 hypothetical protein [Nanoarchaeota archaeon]